MFFRSVCRTKCVLFCLINILWCLPALAEPQIQEDVQSWQVFSLRTHITAQWQGYMDSQNNVTNLVNLKAKQESQLINRFAIGRQVSNTISVWQGYSWIPSFTPSIHSENQLWEQIWYEKQFKHFSLSNRIRLEIRRQQSIDGTPIRVWNQAKLTIPIHNTPWYVATYVIPFVNLNTLQHGPHRGFNQNWAFIGLGRKLSKDVNLEVGYLNNYVHTPLGTPNRMNHVLFVSLNYNFSKPIWNRQQDTTPPNKQTIPDKNNLIQTQYRSIKLDQPDTEFDIMPITFQSDKGFSNLRL